MCNQLIVLCFALCSVSLAIESNTGIFMVKESYRNNVGIFYKSTQHQTLQSCGHACLRDSRCIGTNFRFGSNGECVCEFVDMPPSSLLSKLEFDHDWVFSLNMKDDCRFVKCNNGGTCVYHRKPNKYICVCALIWTGDKCEHIKVSSAIFHFTVLGTRGRLGPTNNSNYHGTALQSTLIAKGIQIWRVPVAGKYHLTVCGATGGNATNDNHGGKGALVNGTIQLEKDDLLEIIIGQRGMTCSQNPIGSGGGGTFIALNKIPLLIAGGGGGGGINTDGGDGRIKCGFGSGGEVCAKGGTTSAGGGGGFSGDGTCYMSSPCVNKRCKNAGKSFLNGGEGGTDTIQNCNGGYGGGGASSNAPGGGGGYSGGKVTLKAFPNHTIYMYAEGGCSFAPSGGLVTTGYNDGDGYAIIKLLL